MEASKIGENEGRKEVDEVSDAETENEEVLKKIIASHPLYEVLIESHINCLKVISSCFLFFFFRYILLTSILSHKYSISEDLLLIVVNILREKDTETTKACCILQKD